VVAGTVLTAFAEPSDKNPHHYKGYGYENPGASLWERRHGILPGGAGFVYDQKKVGKKVVNESLSDTSCTKLRGLFVRQCQPSGQSPDGQPISTTDTRYYDSQNGYELDRTYYVGDSSCTPGESDIDFKLNLHGEISYHGKSPDQVQLNDPNWGSVCEAEMTWTTSTIILGDNARGRQMAADLGSHCPCGNNWTAPGTITTYPSNCSASDNSSTYYYCHLITGGQEYFNYAWDTPKLQYATSADSFGDDPNQWWVNHVSTDYTRELITEGFNHDPNQCSGYLKNGPCHPTNGETPGCACLNDAQVACRSCIGLECDGCLLRELDPKFDPAADNNIWHVCCPCIYDYEERQDHNWQAAIGRC